MKLKILLVLVGLFVEFSAMAGDLEQGLAAYNKQNYEEAMNWWVIAAKQGNADAQYNLGVMYDNGRGVPQDYKEAAKWYQLAAMQGHASAQHNLGVMYEVGRGIPQDDSEAVRLYQLAANQGNASAQLNLGYMYAHGRGVPQDDSEAVRLFQLAANQGNDVAQLNLGNRFSIGKGVPQNYSEAKKWYSLAAEQGNQAAKDKLDSLPDKIKLASKERKNIKAFRTSIKDGSETNCGPVIEVKGKLLKVAYAIENYGNEHWIRREEVFPPEYGCRFFNGNYVSPGYQN